MIRLAISVEGETEEEFVKEVIAERLRIYGVEPYPILLGGDVTLDRLASDMAELYWSFDFVTSLVDFYGFRGKGSDTVEELERRIHTTVVAKINRSFDESRIFPYVQLHEFEGLLFSDVNAFTWLGVSDEILDALRNIRSRFITPEDINNSVDTAPSKRLESLMPRYHKRVDGPVVALEIGLDRIRAECPRFDKWVAHLESLEQIP